MISSVANFKLNEFIIKIKEQINIKQSFYRLIIILNHLYQLTIPNTHSFHTPKRSEVS